MTLRKLAQLALGLLLSVVAMVVVAWLARATIVESLLQRRLDASGAKAIIRIQEISWGHAVFSLSWLEPNLVFPQLRAQWSGDFQAGSFKFELDADGKDIPTGKISPSNAQLQVIGEIDQGVLTDLNVGLQLGGFVWQGSEFRLVEVNLELTQRTATFKVWAEQQDAQEHSLKFVGARVQGEGLISTKGTLTVQSSRVHAAGMSSLVIDDRGLGWDWNQVTVLNRNRKLREWLGKRSQFDISLRTEHDLISASLSIAKLNNQYVTLSQPLKANLIQTGNSTYDLTLGMGGNEAQLAMGSGWSFSSLNGNLKLDSEKESVQGTIKVIPILYDKNRQVVAKPEYVEANIEWGEAVRTNLLIKSLVLAGLEDFIYPLNVKLGLLGTPDAFTVDASLVDMIDQPWLSWKGQGSATKQKVNLELDHRWDLAETDFSTITPIFDETITKPKGELALQGRLDIVAGQYKQGKLKVEIKDVSAIVDAVPLTDINGQIQFEDIKSVLLGEPATFTIAKIGDEVPITDVGIRVLNASKPGRLRVETLRAQWSTGVAYCDPFDLVVSPFSFETTLFIVDLEIGKLLESAQMSQVETTAVAQGRIPVIFKDGFLAIEKGRLTNAGKGGKLKYKGMPLAGVQDKIEYLHQFEQLMAQGQQALVFKALDNFVFKDFELDVTRDLKTGLRALVTLEGHNPDLANGQPFKFHVDLSGQLENLLKQSLMKGMMDPESFTKSLKK